MSRYKIINRLLRLLPLKGVGGSLVLLFCLNVQAQDAVPTDSLVQDGIVRVAFAGYCTTENKNDEFYLFVFCPDQHEGRFVAPVARFIGSVEATIPEEWKGHALHLYAFMKGKRLRTSDSVYVGQFSVKV